MTRIKFILVSVFITFLFSCNETKIPAASVQIIPQPNQLTNHKGQFILDNSVGLNYDETFSVSAEFLKAYIEENSNIKLSDNNMISFVKDETITSNEGYKLNLTTNQIEIKAKTDQGSVLCRTKFTTITTNRI